MIWLQSINQISFLQVHFANLSPPESPMSDTMNINFHEGEGE